MSVFMARDISLVTASGRRPDHDEELELVRAKPADVLRGEIALESGAQARIVDAKTLIAAAWLCRLNAPERDR
jgi:hypothetical protein